MSAETSPPPRDRVALARNTAYVALSSASDGLLLLLLLLAARRLGPDPFGVLTFGLALATAASFLLNLGLDTLSVRRIAVSPDGAPRLMGGVLLWKLGFSALLTAIFVALLPVIVPEPSARTSVALLFASGVLRSLVLTLRSFLQGFERFGLELAGTLGDRTALAALGIAVLVGGGGVADLARVFLGVRLVTVVALFALLRIRVSRVSVGDLGPLWALQREAAPLGLAILVTALSGQIDVFLLSFLADTREVGLFGAGYKIYEGLLVLPAVFHFAFLPRMSRWYARERERHHDLFGRAVKYLLVVCGVLFVSGLHFAPRFVDLVYGVEYIRATPVIRWLAASLVVFVGSAMMGTALIAAGRQKAFLIANVAGLVVRGGFGLLWIPAWRAPGAAAAVLAGAVASLGVLLLALRGEGYRLHGGWRTAAKIGAAAATLAIVLRALDEHALLALAVGVGSYAAVLLVSRTFDVHETSVIRHALGRAGRD